MSKTKFTNINWSTYVATSNRGDGCVFINDGFNQVAVLDFKKASKTKVVSRGHLIAAAPEMYARLERINQGYKNLIELDYVPVRLHSEIEKIIDETEKLLAKARGEV